MATAVRRGRGIKDRNIGESAGIRPYKLDLVYASTTAFLAAKSARNENSSSAEEGDVFFNSTTGLLNVYANSAWRDVAMPATSGAAAGDLQYFDGTNWVRLAAGDAHDPLVMNAAGTAPVWGTASIQMTKTTLSNAELNALETTAVDVAPAPGAGYVNVFMGGIIKHQYGGTNAWTEGGNDNFVIRYTDASGAIVSQPVEGTGFWTLTADSQTSIQPKIDAIVASASAENQTLAIFNPGTGLAGNAGADNTADVYCYYIVQAVT